MEDDYNHVSEELVYCLTNVPGPGLVGGIPADLGGCLCTVCAFISTAHHFPLFFITFPPFFPPDHLQCWLLPSPHLSPLYFWRAAGQRGRRQPANIRVQLRGFNFILLTLTLADGCHVSSAAVSLQDARTELPNWDLFLISSDPILHLSTRIIYCWLFSGWQNWAQKDGELWQIAIYLRVSLFVNMQGKYWEGRWPELELKDRLQMGKRTISWFWGSTPVVLRLPGLLLIRLWLEILAAIWTTPALPTLPCFQ